MATFFKTVQNTVKHWYIPAIIGVLFILLGIYLFANPLSTYLSLSIFFSLSFLITGVLEIYFSIQNKDELEGWGWYLVSGIIGTIMGLILIVRPEVAATTLPFFVGFVLLFRAFQGLGFAFDLKNYGVNGWGNLALISVLGIVFSFVLLANPVFAGMSLVVFTAIAFVLVGIEALVLAFRLKKLKNLPNKISDDLKSKINALKEEYYTHLHK